MTYVNRAKEIQKDIVEYRRRLHENPEIGMELPETVKYVREKLHSFGYEVEDCGGGLSATCGKQGKTILLRADMDALRMNEENDLPFRSKNEYAHMCGHDMHTAILLGAARLLKENELNLNGRIKLMFQPGEEVLLGAKTMVNEGILDDPKVDAAMGLHVLPHMENGTFTYKIGGALSSVSLFKINAEGRGGHSSVLEMVVDPIKSLVQIYSAIEGIVARELSMFSSATCSVGIINAGTMPNIIPKTASMEGSIRCYCKEDNDKIISALEKIVKGVAIANETKCTMEYEYLPALVNDDDFCKEIASVYETIDGLDFYEESLPINGSEDFAYVSELVPTMYLLLGVGRAGNPVNHSPNAIFNEDKMCLASAAMATMVTNWLAKE